MKNINLVPSSPEPVSVRGNKPFIVISLIVLMLLSFVYFLGISPIGKQTVSFFRNRLITKIGFFLRDKASKKTEQAPVAQKPHDVEKGIEGQLKSKDAVEDEKKIAAEKRKPVPVKSEGNVKKNKLAEAPGGRKTERAGSTVKPKERSIQQERVAKVASVETREKPEKKISKVEVKGKPALKKEKVRIPSAQAKKETASAYYLQVSSFVIKGNADKAYKKLGGLGYSPTIKETVAKVKMHNIYTDYFPKRTDAQNALNRIKRKGFDPVLISASGGRYKLRIASCYYKESARKLIKELNRLGYTNLSITRESTPTRMYSILLLDFKSLQEADAARQKLIRNGFQSPILKNMPTA
jgi:hypothetical protein